MALIVCPECGSQVSGKAEKCLICGCPSSEFNHKTEVVRLICPECGQIIKNSNSACPNCGCPSSDFKTENHKYLCPDCGQDISESDSPCPNCGCPSELFQIRSNEDIKTTVDNKQNSSKFNNHVGRYVTLILWCVVLFIWFAKRTKNTDGTSSSFSYPTENSYSSQKSYASSSNASKYASSTGYSYQFTGAHSVMSYLMSHKFVASNGLILTVKDACLYVNGRCISGAINIYDVSSSRALLIANTPFTGGRNRMIVDCINGYVQDCNSNDVYYVQ